MGFTKNNYYKEKFVKETLSNETLSEIEFEDCTFTDCSFVDCTVRACKFINTTFRGCVISAMVTTDSRFVDVHFINSKVIGVDWTKAQQVQGLWFEESQINYDNFRMLKLPKIKMISCEAKESDFLEADMTEGVFTDTDFERSIFLKTNLTKANFVGAKNYFIDPKNNTITKAHFSLPEALTLLDGLNIHIE